VSRADRLAKAPERRVSVRIGEFSFKALEGEGGSGAEHVRPRLAQAVRLYLSDRGSNRPGWAYPPFRRGGESGGVEVELAVAGDLWQAFEREAGRQGASTSQLAEHAALLYAADVDAGRITRRILDDLDEGETRGTGT
jgi:hypothetical protein